MSDGLSHRAAPRTARSTPPQTDGGTEGRRGLKSSWAEEWRQEKNLSEQRRSNLLDPAEETNAAFIPLSAGWREDMSTCTFTTVKMLWLPAPVISSMFSPVMESFQFVQEPKKDADSF